MAHWIRPIARKLGFRNNASRQRPARRLSLLPLEDRVVPSGETINQMIGVIPGNRSVTIGFNVTVDSPLPKGHDRVWNHGAVSGTGFSTVATDDPGQGGPIDPTRSFIDQPPQVTRVFLNSSAWTPAFRANLQTQGLGDGTFGFAVGTGANQLLTLPWFGLDRISIRFNENVNIAADDLQLLGVNTATYTLPAGGFSYDNTTFTATWSVTGGIDQDKLRVVLASGAGGVTAANDGKFLDGEWIDSTAVFNSGDGQPGADFSFRFNVQPGDANRDGVVNTTDGVILRKIIGAASYDSFADMNGNNTVDMADFMQYRARIGTLQPAGDPGGTAGSGWVAATTPTPPTPPGVAGTTITASKAVSLLTDLDGDGLADPGDTLRYLITITNTTASPVSNIALTDTIDLRTSLVAGSVHVSPIANPDNYTWAVNTQLDSAARGLPSLFSNDSISSGSDTIVLSGPTTITTTLGGSVTINPTTGAFVYTPEAGDTGNDTFTYTIANSNDAGLTSMATVTIGLGTQRVWYVQGGATNGDGRSHNPFNSPASASTAATGTDIIYVLSSGPALDGPFTLENNQQLLGQGVALTVNTVTPFTAGTRPTLSNLNGDNITLASGNTVRGLTLSNALGISVTGSNIGTFTMDTVSKSGSGRALNIATGTLAVTFDSITSSSSSGGAVVSLLTVGGSLTVTNNAGTDTNIAGASAGISIAGAPAGSTFNFGDTVNGSSGVGLSLSSNNAATTTTFASLAITTTAGKGIETNAAGNLSIGGTGNTVSATGGAALDIANTTITGGVTFSSVTSSGGLNGVQLVNLSGNITLGTGTISGTTGTAFVLNTGTAVVDYDGTITVTNGQSGVTATTMQGGSLSLGTVNVSGTGAGIDAISIDGNGAAAFDLTIDSVTINTNAMRHGIRFSDLIAGSDILISTGTVTSQGAGKRVVDFSATAGFYNMSGVTFDGTNSDGIDILSGQAGTYTFGSFTANTPTGGIAVDIQGTAAAVAFGGITSTTTGSGVNIVNHTGNLTVLGGTLTRTTGAAAGIALLDISGGNATLNYGGNVTNSSGLAVEITARNGGAVTLSGSVTNSGVGLGVHVHDNSAGSTTFSGTVTVANTNAVTFPVNLALNTGHTINFTSHLDIDATASAFNADQGGTLNIGAAGNTTIDTTSGTALNLSGIITTTGITIDTLNRSGSGNGITMTNVTGAGTVTVTSGTIQGTTSRGVDISGGTTNINIGATLSNATGADSRTVEVSGKTAGTITFSGAIDENDDGIILTSNTGGTISFTGGMDISTGAATGFSATGGGTVTATQNNTTILNTITTTTATALNVVSTTIGVAGLTFRSISAGTVAGSAGVGIILDTTGSSGGLTVTGNVTAGSGGTIQHKTGADNSLTSGIGIKLNDTRNVSLTRMQLNDFDNFAIRGHGVTNFTLLNSVINGNNGTSAIADVDIVNGEDTIRIINLLGTALIDGCFIGGGYEQNLRIVNDTGTLNRLTVNNSTIGDLDGAGPGRGVDPTNGDDNVVFEARTPGTVMNVTLTDNILNNARGDVIQTNASLGTTMDVVFRHNAVSNNHPNIVIAGGGATFSGLGSVTYTISINSFRDSKGIGVNVFKGRPGNGQGAGGTWTGTIFNNRVGVSGVPDSGGLGSGIAVEAQGNGTHTTLIKNNQVFNHNEAGIRVGVVDANTTVPTALTMNATVIGNTVSQPDPVNGFAGFYAIQGAVNPADATTTLNLKLGGAGAEQNNFVDGDPFNSNDVFLQRATSPQIGAFNLSRGVSGSNDPATIVMANNVAPITVFADTGITPVNTLPPLPPPIDESGSPPMLSAPGGVQSVNPLPPASRLTESQLAPIFAEAVRRWELRGLDAAMTAALKRATFQIVDLQAGYLGQAPLYGSVISLDVTADGYGWYVDPTPGDDSEFANAKSSTRFYTDSTMEPAGRMDLLTTVMHELGHVLGLDSSFNPADRNDIMYAYLTTGERRLNIDPAADVVLQPVPFIGPLAIDSSSRSQTPFGNAESRNSVSQASSFNGSRSQTEFGNEGKRNEGKSIAWWMTPIELNKAKRHGPFVNWSDSNS